MQLCVQRLWLELLSYKMGHLETIDVASINAIDFFIISIFKG